MTEEQDNQEAEYFPKWLGSALLYDDLPWDKSTEYSVPTFLDKYTLHDSLWVNLFYDVANDNEVVLIIFWDAVWLPEEIKKGGTFIGDWPLLFIKLKNIRQVSTLGYEHVSNIHRGIGTAECEEIEGKKIFVIHDHYGGSVEIVFEGTSHFLALNEQKEHLKI